MTDDFDDRHVRNRPPYMAIWELKAWSSGVLIAVGIVGFLVVMWLMLRGNS